VRVSLVEEATHFVGEPFDIVGREVVSAAGIHRNGPTVLPTKAIGQEPVEGLSGNLRGGIPQRHVERSHGNRPLAMASRLLVFHHAVPAEKRIDRVAASSRQVVSRQKPRREALADEARLPEAPDRGESVAHDGATVTLLVGHECDDARRKISRR
jgi:hypothetical protein